MKKPKPKKSPRVLIRPLAADDCAPFISAVGRSRTLHRLWITPKAKAPKEFAEYLERFDGSYRHSFLVIHRESNELVGIININDVIRGAFQSGSVGYYAFAPHAGQELISNDYGFTTTR